MEFESKDGSVGGDGGVQEFQAVIFAPGSSPLLHPLTADASSAPKALLPVAGRPLLAYQLDLLAKAGFSGACAGGGWIDACHLGWGRGPPMLMCGGYVW